MQHDTGELIQAQVGQPLNFGTDDSARVAWLCDNGVQLQGQKVVLWYPHAGLGLEAPGAPHHMDPRA